MDQRVVQLEEWTLTIWRWLTSFYHDEYGADLASSVISEKFKEANKKIGDLQEEVRVLKMKVEFLEQTVDGLKDKKINLNTVWLMKEMKTMKAMKAIKAMKRRKVLKKAQKAKK